MRDHVKLSLIWGTVIAVFCLTLFGMVTQIVTHGQNTQAQTAKAHYSVCKTLPVNQRLSCINNGTNPRFNAAQKCSDLQQQAATNSSPFDWQQCMTDLLELQR